MLTTKFQHCAFKLFTGVWQREVGNLVSHFLASEVSFNISVSFLKVSRSSSIP